MNLPTELSSSESNELRRFVILEHTGTASYKPGVHWDLLCEEGETLRAWEFPEPLTVLRQKVHALPAHRLIYLDYEGPITGDRGSVRRIAEGTYLLLRETATEWVVRLNGKTFHGELRLSRETPEQLIWEAVLAPGC
jgi:hypothetical protein